MKFVVKDHSVRPDQQMVEVLDDYGVLIAAIYGHEVGLHIASKYLDYVALSEDTQPPSVLVHLGAATQ